MLIIFASLVLSMTTRYRSADGIERQQMKWFFLSLGIAAMALAIMSSEVVILNRPDNSTVSRSMFARGAVVPIAIGIAILRYGLFEIDRIISRTLGLCPGHRHAGRGLRRPRSSGSRRCWRR